MTKWQACAVLADLEELQKASADGAPVSGSRLAALLSEGWEPYAVIPHSAKVWVHLRRSREG